jgi:hypothetical protein
VSTPSDGGPAFPLNDCEWGTERQHNNGMTLRDYFAAHATEADIANIYKPWPSPVPDMYMHTEYTRAEKRFVHAAAMLAARKATP